MAVPVVWINKYLGNTWDILRRLKRDRRPGEFTLLHSHPNPRDRSRFHVDKFVVEPDGLNSADYVEYCLDVAKRHRVALFVPGRKLPSIVRAKARFEAIGTRLLAAGGTTTLTTLNHKGRLYAALEGMDVRLPEAVIVNNLAGFEAAWTAMRSRHVLLCYKPAVSINGIGFQVVVDRAIPATYDIPAELRISLADARRKLAARSRFRDLMVMEYLPGPERSVDCLGHRGQLLRCVVRRKQRGRQVIERQPDIVAAVGRLTARFKLTGVFNVQFRDVDGEPHLLEINPRMSGGLVIACAAGVNLPLWAIRLALETARPEDVPYPRAGLRIPQPRRAPSR